MTPKFRRTFIVGCGCTAFVKPRGQRTTEYMGFEAATKALLDEGKAPSTYDLRMNRSVSTTYDEVQTAYVGHCCGDSTTGQHALYSLGMIGIPIMNVNDNCSTGSTALYGANNAVKTCLAECALVLSFERMAPGSIVATHTPDRPSPLESFYAKSQELESSLKAGKNFGSDPPRIAGNGGQEYREKYSADITHLAKIAAKNHKHSVNNPYSQFRKRFTEEQVLNSPNVNNQLTTYMCTPNADGAACCIVASEDFVRTHKLENQAIKIVAQALETDEPTTLESRRPMGVIGYSMAKSCTDKVFVQAGFASGNGRDEVGVVELHDCFARNEVWQGHMLSNLVPNQTVIAHNDAAHKLVGRGDNTYGGKYVVNSSGGLEARRGASGLAMHSSSPLRDWAGPMQAPGLFSIADKRSKFGLVHDPIGVGGAVVISLLRRPEFFKPGGDDERTRLGCNHNCECDPITRADLDKVKSKVSLYVLRTTKL